MIFKCDDKIEGYAVTFDSYDNKFSAIADDGNPIAKSQDLERLRAALVKRTQEKKPAFQRVPVLVISSEGKVEKCEVTSVTDDGHAWLSGQERRKIKHSQRNNYGTTIYADTSENLAIAAELANLNNDVQRIECMMKEKALELVIYEP